MDGQNKNFKSVQNPGFYLENRVQGERKVKKKTVRLSPDCVTLPVTFKTEYQENETNWI